MDHAITTPIASDQGDLGGRGRAARGHSHGLLSSPSAQLVSTFAEGSKAAVGGALLAAMNTASEYGFGAVIAALPGFLAIANALSAIPNPLVNEAMTVTSLAGITGSASGGMSIALAAMAKDFIALAEAAHIPLGGAAPRRIDGERRHGHAAAQRRRHHAARGDRPDAPRNRTRIFSPSPS